MCIEIGGFAYMMKLIWMSRCFHSSVHSLHLVNLSSKEITFTKSEYCLRLPVCLQPDGPGADLLAFFLFVKGCILLAFLCHFRYEEIGGKHLCNLQALFGVPKILHLLGFVF